MRRTWLVVFVALSAALVAVAALGWPVAALLGGLVLFSAATAIGVGSRVVFVDELTALVVRSALDERVLRVVPGPGWTFLLPFREKAGPLLATGRRLQEIDVSEVLLPDQQPVLLNLTASVLHQVTPQVLAPDALGQVLPDLVNSLPQMVRYYADYCLRALVAGGALDRPDNAGRQRLERQLTQVLAGYLAGLGVTVHEVRLVIRPPAGLAQSLTTAEQQRVGIDLQARQLAALLAALTGQQQQAHDLALLELARSLGNSGESWTSLDLASWLDLDGRPADRALAARLPLWGGRQPSGRRAEGAAVPPLPPGR